MGKPIGMNAGHSSAQNRLNNVSYINTIYNGKVMFSEVFVCPEGGWRGGFHLRGVPSLVGGFMNGGFCEGGVP